MNPAVYFCQCCAVRRADDTCSCVYTLCRRCVHCLSHCVCAEKHVRACAAADGLDDPSGPFADLAVSKDPD